MKANELMIGDWVQIAEPCKYAGAIGRIKTLIDHKDGENAYFKVFLQNNTKHIGIVDICSDDIRPIPLEKKHLKKNGFEVREYSDDTEYFYHDGYRINIDFNEGLPADDIPPTIFLSIDFAEKDTAMPIEYLHELQQAMRVMGCDKEIKI